MGKVLGLLLALLPIDACFRLSQKLAFRLANLSHLKEQLSGRAARFYRHELTLSQWLYRTEMWSFAGRGSFAALHMPRGSKILDLCSGDGSLPYLFYSDAASHIDAVDIDAAAIAYSRSRYSKPNIVHHRLDVVVDDAPSNDYDWVVFNASMYNFTESELDRIVDRLAASNRKPFAFIGTIARGTGHAEHKFEFKDASGLETFLRRHFRTLQVHEACESDRLSFYFVASGPITRPVIRQ